MRSLCLLTLLALSCRHPPPRDWGEFDRFAPPPGGPRFAGLAEVGAADAERFERWGEHYFKHGGFGNERSAHDVLGLLQGSLDTPDGHSAVLDHVFAAIDALDGESGNLFQGNGGGHTSDLVLRFPKGTRLHGLPVPEAVHTGLDVEAGDWFPLGVNPVRVDGPDADLPFLLRPRELGLDGAPDGAFRLGMSCAVCHYSLDVDQDGTADLASTRLDRPTPETPFQPRHGWAVGNQDLDFGWLVALSKNPLLASLRMGGNVHRAERDTAREWALRVADGVASDRPGIRREVVQSILMQPRGWADMTGDSRFNTVQIPPLYTRGAWPASPSGAFFDARDRNNTLWTGALDFTGHIGLCGDRARRVPWEDPSPLAALSCDALVDLWLADAPASEVPAYRERLAADILGTSDGVPGLLDPDSVFVLQTSGAVPDGVFEAAPPDRRRDVADYREGELRGQMLAWLGVRLGVPPGFEGRDEVAAITATYGTDADDFILDVVSFMLDGLEPPPNPSWWLQGDTLVKRGEAVFVENGCASCHAGPFLTDNQIHWLGPDASRQYGSFRAASTLEYREPFRSYGPPIGTEPQRAASARTARRLVSPPYDPATGRATRSGGPFHGLLAVQEIGYKTPSLRGLWTSAPYLHDGGVSVAVLPNAGPVYSLSEHLQRNGDVLVYGAGGVVAHNASPEKAQIRADAAWSLQALLLERVRKRIVAENHKPTLSVVGSDQTRSMAFVGVTGEGHRFFVDDDPGGDDITALIAFLLAMDDCPSDVLGRPCAGDP